ncbi:unnamed protein product [Rhizopus stolonifer]
MMLNRSKGFYNNMWPASFYRTICLLLKKKPSIECLSESYFFNKLHLSGIVNLIHPHMSKVILSSLSVHLKTKLDYTFKIPQFDTDTLAYTERILGFGSDIDALEFIMATKTALIRDHKRNPRQYTNLAIIEQVVNNLNFGRQNIMK